ncbi:MAG: hypothetical protein ABEI54_05275 [Candidatus Bipolaricaulia bacterium]
MAQQIIELTPEIDRVLRRALEKEEVSPEEKESLRHQLDNPLYSVADVDHNFIAEQIQEQLERSEEEPVTQQEIERVVDYYEREVSAMLKHYDGIPVAVEALRRED